MSSSTPPSFASAEHPSWRDLYMAALFESDKNTASALIAKAERALLLRERELFASLQDPAEREAVNNALHSLAALKRCLGVGSSTMAA
jgi:hypothetical protein